MDEDDGAGGGGNGAANAFGVDLPSVIVDQEGGFEGYVVEDGEDFEEGVSGLEGEDFAAWFA